MARLDAHDFASQTQPAGKSLYATVITAALAGKTLSLAVSGCALNGQVSQIYRIDIQP
jgi:hypothetical protein